MNTTYINTELDKAAKALKTLSGTPTNERSIVSLRNEHNRLQTLIYGSSEAAEMTRLLHIKKVK